MVENTVVLRPSREGRTYVFGRVMGGLGGRRLEIRTCFPNPIRATHRNTCPIFQHLANYNPPIKKYNGANQKVQKRDVFFAPRFLYPFHTSKGGIFAPFDRLLYFLEGRRVDQIEHDDLITACLHCGTAAAEGGNRIAQRLTLDGIV